MEVAFRAWSIIPRNCLGHGGLCFALDRHTVSSEYLGDDAFGNAVYETVRSPLGEMLYRLKYRRDELALNPIVGVATDFLKKWTPMIDLILPVPPSNERRKHQPVSLNAEALAREIGIELCSDCIAKSKPTGELKDIHVYAERVKFFEARSPCGERESKRAECS